jgi:hypothetical protein
MINGHWRSLTLTLHQNFGGKVHYSQLKWRLKTDKANLKLAPSIDKNQSFN